MNITFYSNVTGRQLAMKHLPFLDEHNVKFIHLDERAELICSCGDTDILVVDAMGVVDREIIDAMPRLRLIQSEGVGYQGVDTDYALLKGIPVCNNKGVNDTAVAENALLLMLACLRSIITGCESVYNGRQIEVKKASFGVIRELSQCTVGLVGFGDIARKTAQMCRALGARVIYTNRTRYPELETEFGVEYRDMNALLSESDFVSLHIAVTDETKNTANSSFFEKMKSTAYLINTARGELVDNNALLSALLNDSIAGAGLDVIAPEPVTADNILLDERIRNKLIITPHIAGITSLTVKKIFENIGYNIKGCENGRELKNRVN